MSFFTIVTLGMCGIHVYLWFKLRHLFVSPQNKFLLFIFLAAMLGLILARRRDLYAMLPDFIPWTAYTWLGFTIIVFGCFAAYDALRIFILAARLISGKAMLQFLAPRSATPMVLLIALAVSGYAMFEARNVAVRRFELTTPKQIKGGGLRIVAASDLHIGETIDAADVSKWVALIKAEKPDLLVLAGDIIDADMSGRDEEARLLRSITATYGSYAVLGNHEMHSGLRNSRDFISRSGLTLLENTSDVSGPVNIVGINDPRADGGQLNVPSLLAGVDQKKFTLLLKHQPVFQDGEAGLFDLQFSGHTHGGQIWPIRYIVRKIFKFSQGLGEVDGANGRSLLYLMNGTGYWGPPMRLLSRPEIVVFDISSVDRSGGNI